MHAWTTPKCKDGTERGTDFGFRAPAELNAPLKPGQAKPTVGTIYSEIGFAGLWGGLGTRILMVGTLTALQWVRRFRIIESQKNRTLLLTFSALQLIYDTFKVTMGLPTTGSAAPDPTKK